MNIPVLTQPRLLGFKNRLLHKGTLRQRFQRDFVIFLLSALIMSITYSGSSSLFQGLQQLESTFTIPIVALISLFLTILFVMVQLSTLISALSSLYLSKDLERILASPIKTRSFFIGKTLETVHSASWMVLVFASPTLLAFVVNFNLSFLQSCFAALLCCLLVLLPTLWSMGGAILFARFFPLQQVRRILFLVAVAAIGCIYMLVQLIGGSPPGSDRNDTLNQIFGYISSPVYEYLPPHWVALILEAMTSSNNTNVAAITIAIVCLTTASAASVFLLLDYAYHSTYSASIQRRNSVKIDSKAGQKRLAAAFFFLSPPVRAIVGKEVKLFARDMSQALQLFMLIGLCALYLYNFGAVSALMSKTEKSDVVAWWELAMALVNFGMGCFVVTAVCSRFVFPSISIEGKSFWILSSSALSIQDVLRVKFWFWYLPVMVIATVILTSGSLAIQAPPSVVIGTILASLISSYGIVGVAVGLGGFFSQFDWEHVSQLSANLGSLIFMIASMMLVAISMVPIAVLLLVFYLHGAGGFSNEASYIAAIASSWILLAYTHVLARRWALSMGTAALNRQRN